MERYKTQKAFVETLLKHNFNNDTLHIKFEDSDKNLCYVKIIDKLTGTTYHGLFGAFMVFNTIVGSLKFPDRKIVILTQDASIEYPAIINERAEYFIDYLENNLIGITDEC